MLVSQTSKLKIKYLSVSFCKFNLLRTVHLEFLYHCLKRITEWNIYPFHEPRWFVCFRTIEKVEWYFYSVLVGGCRSPVNPGHECAPGYFIFRYFKL